MLVLRAYEISIGDPGRSRGDHGNQVAGRGMQARVWGFCGGLVLAAFCAAQAPVPPKEARRAFEKAEAALKARRTDEAIRDFEQAVALSPAYAEAWCDLGMLRMEQQQADGAREALEAAVRADPKLVRGYLLLAALEQAARRWERVVELTDVALRLDSIDYPQAWLLNAIARSNVQDFAAAERSARESERLDTAHKLADCRRLLGLLLEQRGDFAGAAGQFREYLKMAPSGPDLVAIRTRLAEVAARAGETAEAEAAPALSQQTYQPGGDSLPASPQPGPAGACSRPRGHRNPRGWGGKEDRRVSKVGTAARSVPVEISVLFDCSSSVDRVNKLDPRVFHESLLDEFPNASIAVYGFSDDLMRLSRPTRDAASLKKAMDLVAAIPQRDTPLFGSIADTVRDASSTGANVIRMVVILSDGESTSPGDASRVEEAARVAKEAGASLFPVMLNSLAAGSSREAADSVKGFMGLAAATGGKEFFGLMGGNVLPTVLQGLAREMRSDYVAGFYVAASAEPKRHRIEVVLRSKEQGRIYGGSRELVH